MLLLSGICVLTSCEMLLLLPPPPPRSLSAWPRLDSTLSFSFFLSFPFHLIFIPFVLGGLLGLLPCFCFWFCLHVRFLVSVFASWLIFLAIFQMSVSCDLLPYFFSSLYLHRFTHLCFIKSHYQSCAKRIGLVMVAETYINHSHLSFENSIRLDIKTLRYGSWNNRG